MAFEQQLVNEARRMGIELSAEQAGAMYDFWVFLKKENAYRNLTAIVDDGEAVIKHFLDSLTVLLVEALPRGARLVDVGAGAGFPGIPLAIVRPDYDVVLVESVGKKADFMRRAAEKLGLAVRVARARAEDLGRQPDYREQFDVAVARALAPLPVACEWCLPLVKVGGLFVAMRGARGEDDLREAQRAMDALGAKVAQIRHLELPEEAGARVLIAMKKIKSVPDRFPRPGGQARRQPL